MRKPIFAFEKYSTKLSIFGLLLALCGGACGIAAAAFSSKPQAAAAVAESWTPSEEEEIERAELAVTVTSSALTDTSQSIGTIFRSQKVDVANNGPRYLNVFLAPDDANFSTFDQVIEECKAAKTAAEQAGQEYEMPVYNATVYNIQYNRSAGASIVIPEYSIYSSFFSLHVTTIQSNVVFNQRSGQTDYGGIKKIVIPASITEIGDDAFYDTPEDLEICVEAPETYIDETEEETATYPNDWTLHEHVTFGYELTDAEKKLLSVKSSSYTSLGKGSDFFLGYYEGETHYPLYMEYKFEAVDDQGNWEILPEKHYIQVPLSSTNTNYDAVGSVMGVNSISPYIEIDLPAGRRVNLYSIFFHNIFRAVRGVDGEGNPTGKMVPDLETGPLLSTPAISNFVTPHFSELFAIKPNSASSLAGFLHFDVVLTRMEGEGYGVYPDLNPHLFSQHKSEIDAKTVQIRYQFATLDRANYRFTFDENGVLTTLTVRVSTPVSYVLAGNGDTKFGFLVEESKFDGHSFANLTKVELCGFAVKLDLYKVETNSILTKSSTSVRFAALSLFDNIHSVNHTDIGMLLLVAYLVYVGVYVVAATAYYFYAKKRFRNDEFRRVNNKKYIVAAAKNFVGCALILSAVLFIVSRWGLLYSSIVVFNPVDAFVIVFALAAAIYIGFSIKNIVISIKNAKKRRQAARLHLDDDVVDDGTH